MKVARHRDRPFNNRKYGNLKIAMLAAAIFCFVQPLAHAQTAPAATSAQSFDIPAQPLATALREFARQSGQELLFSPDVAAEKTTGGIKGTLPPLEALSVLLKNTGINFSTTSKGAILLRSNDRQAAQAHAPTGLTTSVPDNSSKHFEIEAKPLADALMEFGVQSGLTVVAPTTLTAGKKAATVRGDLAPTDALGRLLKGSGLTFARAADGTIAIQAIPSSEPVQASAGESSLDKDLTVLEEVVVTAQKRQERLIEVPLSVSVLSADYLDKINALQFRDFANTVPGLSFQTNRAGATQISLRGTTVGFDPVPTVAIYVDDVPYGSSTSFANSSNRALDVGLFDIDRIEVLRGPQGTVWGASTMGGIIRYVSKRPEPENFGVDLQAGISDTWDGDVSYQGAVTVNAPIAADKAALRATGYYFREGGYIDNLALGRNDDSQAEIYGGRATLLLTPTEALSIRIGGFVQDITTNGDIAADFSFAGAPVDGRLEQRRFLATGSEQRFRLVSGTITYDLDWASLTSISSYQTVRNEGIFDNTASFAPILEQFFGLSFSAVGGTGIQTTDKFTQEVRFASEGTRPLEWLIGGFYTHETSNDYFAFVPLFDLDGQPSSIDIFTSSNPSRYEEYALFGNLTWHLTDKFNVTGGVRYARDDQKVGGGPPATGLFAAPPGTPVAPAAPSDEGVYTYLANARYHFSEHATGYLRYATGYRSGGPNPSALDPATGAPMASEPFEADRLRSYEAGFKAESADGSFGIDVSGYYIDWSNIIIPAIRGGFFVRSNAPGGASVKGAELTLSARPADAFTVTGAFAYQDAQMSEADSDLGAAKGERLPNVPRFTAAVNADYELPFWRSLQPTVGATLRYVDDRTSSYDGAADVGANPQFLLSDYTTFDVRAGFALGSVQVQLYGRNLFDERAQLSVFPQSGIASVSTLQPRTVGLNIRIAY